MFDVNKLMKNFMPSPEEMEKLRLERYAEKLETPENFSNWFPSLKKSIDSTETSFLYPESKYATLPIEWTDWLSNDKYTPEKIDDFTDYLIDLLDLVEGKTYFLKTGVFSNKFDFKTTKVTNIHTIGKQYLDMFYASMLLGADSTNEIVIREYIETVEELKTIYSGMPLRTEYRVFVDLKGKDSEIIGVVNYWHPLEMRKMRTNLSNLWDMDEKDLKEVLKEFKRVHNSDNRKSLETEMDIVNYLLAEKKMTKTFNEHKDYVSENILKIAKNMATDKIYGEWSIDVMQNGQEFYVIDAARKHRSALNEYL